MKFYKLFIFVAFLMFLAGCYSGIAGTVVDAETGKPIDGAVVLVEWTRTKGIGFTATESSKVIETITDKDGQFALGGNYSPIGNAPDLTIYKKGYVAWNNKYIFPGYKQRSNFTWSSGQVFKMAPFTSGYSHDEHVTFIKSVIGTTIAYEKKKMLIEAFGWERDLAREEVKKK